MPDAEARAARADRIDAPSRTSPQPAPVQIGSPAVALMAHDLGAVVSASHNPPEYNGVKFFDSQGHKLSDADEEAIEALLDSQIGRAHV